MDQEVHEVRAFSHYLVRKAPTEKTLELYHRALQHNPGTMQAGDRKLFAFALGNQWSVPYIDAGLVVVNPDSEVRRRIYVLCSILEVQPEYVDDFLPQQRSWWYVLILAGMTLRGIVRLLFGIVMVKVIA